MSDWMKSTPLSDLTNEQLVSQHGIASCEWVNNKIPRKQLQEIEAEILRRMSVAGQSSKILVGEIFNLVTDQNNYDDDTLTAPFVWTDDAVEWVTALLKHVAGLAVVAVTEGGDGA